MPLNCIYYLVGRGRYSDIQSVSTIRPHKCNYVTTVLYYACVVEIHVFQKMLTMGHLNESILCKNLGIYSKREY